MVAGIILSTAGCSVKYSFTGASIPESAKTVSIAYFPNMAAMVSPILSTTLTEQLKDAFTRQTRLAIVPDDGDLRFEGQITDYRSTPITISAGEYAMQNRLTISVRVKFTNEQEPQWNYNKTFTQYEDYNTNLLLQDIEGQLIPLIVEKLVEDIFNAAVANW